MPIEIASLPAFVKACDSPQHVQLLQELLKGVKHSSDRHAAARLYAVANKVLKAEVLFPLIADFSSPSSRLAAQVKLLWPAMDGLNITTMAREHAFFPDVPNSVWAASWFLACSYSAEISTLPNTSSYHELLFEQFAFQWLNKKRFADNVPVPGQSAIWVLCFYLAEMSKIMGSSEPIEPATVCTGRVDYSGLSGPVKDFVKAVVEGLEVAIESHGKGRSLSRSLVGLFEVIERGLDTDGLVGWMACRCATSLMEEIDVTYHERALYRRVSIRESVRRSEPWIRLRRLLTPYFRTAIPIDLDSSGRTFTIRILRLGLHKSRPSHVRVNGEFQSVPRVLSDAILGLKALPFSWLDHVPIPAYWSGEIVDGRDDSQVTTCLAALAEQCAMMRPPTVTMDLHQMRRILSIVRKSDDAKVAAGALLVLLDSRFINCTSKQIALRMISADSLYSDISERLFRSDARYQDPQVLRKIGLAEAIVRGEARVSQGCGAAAAAFLADNVKSLATPLPPLESFRKTV